MHIVLYWFIPIVYNDVKKKKIFKTNVLFVKTQIITLEALLITIKQESRISSNISSLFYKCHSLDLQFQTTPFRG